MADHEKPIQASRVNLQGTALQRHIRFFSRSEAENDFIFPQEIYTSLRALGFNVPISLFLTFDFTVHVGYPTSDSLNPAGWVMKGCPVNVKNISRAMHGSDTGTYNRGGEFDEASFERIWEFDM
jgi:peroxygenase